MDAPVHGLMIMAATVAVIFGSVFLIVKVDQWSRSGRDALRERYGSHRWQPAAIDLLGVPLWLVLEIFCLALAILVTIVMMVTAYQAAKGVRDWWHAGARRGR